MNQEKDQPKEITLGIVEANVYSLILFLPFLIVFAGGYVLLWYPKILEWSIKSCLGENILQVVLTPVIIVLGIVAHELIHGLVWGLWNRKGFRAIKFGVIWSMLTPYCHCEVPLKINAYRWGALMPGIVLGFLPSIYSLFSGDFGALLFGLFFTLAAGGDFLMIWVLRKVKNHTLVQDHPSKLGCYLIEE
jgi:hypothetical protein